MNDQSTPDLTSADTSGDDAAADPSAATPPAADASVHPKGALAADGFGPSPESGNPVNRAAMPAAGVAWSGVTRSNATAPRTVSVQTAVLVVVSVLAVLFLAAAVTMTALYVTKDGSAESSSASPNAGSADDRKARQVASDYAVGSLTFGYTDTDAYLDALMAGVSPVLAKNFADNREGLTQVLTGFQVVSTATPLDTVIRSSDHGVYNVVVYASYAMASNQFPTPVNYTTAMQMTLDKNQNWLITAVDSPVDKLNLTGGAIPTDPAASSSASPPSASSPASTKPR